MSRVALSAALGAALLFAAACPPFDALPFPVEGEGEGEGDALGVENVQCAAAPVAPALCGGAQQTADWERIDVDATVDSAVGAIAFDASTPRLVIFTVDGRVWSLSDTDGPTQIATCDGVQARHAFAVLDGTVFASGQGGTCTVLIDGTSAVLPTPAGGGEATAVPIDQIGANIAVVHDEGASFVWETFTRNSGSAVLTSVGVLDDQQAVPNFDADQGKGANVVNAAPGPAGGAAFVDEVGALYVVSFDGTTAGFIAGASFAAVAPSGVALASGSDDVAVAVMDGNSLTLGSVPVAAIAAGSVDGFVELARDPAQFPASNAHVTAVALAGDARLDVGDFGYATLSPSPGASPQPLGTCVRTEDLVDLAATQCGVMWGLTSFGSVLAWQSDTARTGAAVATTVDGSSAVIQFAHDHLDVLDDTRALVSTAGGVVVATFDAAAGAVDVDAASTGQQAGGVAFDESGEHVVVVNNDGSVQIFDPLAPQASLRACDGGLGSDAPDNEFQVAAQNDPTVAAGGVGFFAAAVFAGAPMLVRCTVDTDANTVACDDAAATALPGLERANADDPTLTFSRVATTTAGVLVVTNLGVVLVRAAGDAVLVDNSRDITGAGAAADVFAAGRGRVVDAGDGCVLVFGGADVPFFVDGGDAAPALVPATRTRHDPFPSVGARVEGGHVVASGGTGATFYAIDYDVDAATCAQRFNASDAAVLGPRRPALRITSGAFLDGRAYVGDERGDVYRVPAP